jgi:PAS domain S-box-containing protein
VISDDPSAGLRGRAEERAGAKETDTPHALSPEETRLLLHELRVHQLELEMQNEELRRTQEDLEASRERYFDLYDLAPVGYLTISEQGLIVEANLTAAKMLGVARGALAAQRLTSFILPEDEDIYYRHRKRLFATGAPQVDDLRLANSGGGFFWARVQTAVAEDAVGVCRTVISDITESKRAEEALKTTHTDLQHFSYALTHDLQEPLRMVVNFTQLLAREYEGNLGADADKYISYSVEGALRIEALLKALLDYWEVTERGAQSFSPVDCNQVVSKTLLNLQAAIQQSGAAVTSELLPTLPAEEIMLVRLFQNLISNSIKYRSAAAPAIHISAVRTGDRWLFSVRDNGIGIDPGDAELVFGMFKRLHRKETPGTGIGLALCRKVVERHGGRIWVESEPGRGSTFKFTIAA